MKQFNIRISFAVLFGFLGVFSGAMLLFVSGYLISKSALRPENIMMVYVPIVSVRAFSIGQALFPYLDKLMSHDAVLRIVTKYRKRLYDDLEKDVLNLQDTYQTGDLFHVLSEDMEQLQDAYMKTLFPSVIGLVTYAIVSIIVGIFDMSFMLLFIALLGIIVFLLPTIAYNIMKKRYIKEKQIRSHFYQQITDALFGQIDWLISGRWNELQTNFADTHHTLQLAEKHSNRWNHIMQIIGRFIGGIAIIIAMVWANEMVNENLLSPTVIAAFVLMMFSVIDALLPVREAVQDIPKYVFTIKRMEAITNRGAQEQPVQSCERPTTADIQLKATQFFYKKSQANVIDNVNLTIQQGDKVALLGKSGAGKSTMLKLIAGLIQPTSGDVTIGGIHANESLLGETVAVLNQKPHLFHTSIANNIRIGRQQATDEEIIEVLKKVRLYELVKQLPDGIDTNVESLGKRFSGGERQRIAFARVLIQQTPIIILDEPTTGLDPVTERKLLETFIEAASGQTLLLVTHHLIGAQWMDRIIFLKDGKIHMEGSHHELLSKSKYYRTLYKMDEKM